MSEIEMSSDLEQMAINIPFVVDEVREAFYQYEKALVTNDIARLDNLFFHSEETIRFGQGEDLYGYSQIKEFRKNRPSKNLMRSLKNTVITTYGTTFALASTEFTRQHTDKIGRQQQTWVKFEHGWKIVGAHVSLMDE